MKMMSFLRIHICAILAALLLCISILASAAEIPANQTVLEKTDDSITIVDQMGRTVTVPLPVERIMASDYRLMDILLSIGARDMFIGVDKNFIDRMFYFGLDTPAVSVHGHDINYEYILKLDPDLVIVKPGTNAEEISNKLLGVPVIVVSFDKQDVIPAIEMLGEVLDKEDKANKLIEWINKYDNIVEDRVKNIDPKDMPTFFYGSVRGWNAYKLNAADGCGGINIASDLPGSSTEVSPEWLIAEDPDYIFLDDMRSDMSGWGRTEEDVRANLENLTEEEVEEGFTDLKAISDLKATKNNHVYIIHRDLVSEPRWIVGHICIAKWLHPDLFKDLSPDEIHKEYFREFHGMELNGTFIYPSP